jgi:hypothetical protein
LRTVGIKVLISQDQRALSRVRTLLCGPECLRMAQVHETCG